MQFTVYNKYTNEEEFTGTFDECQTYLGNYGGGWAAMDIKPANEKHLIS